jgi:hypothetical protein
MNHDNCQTIRASQEERIVMLRKALEAQGAAIADNPHYEVQYQQPPVSVVSPPGAASALRTDNSNGQSHAQEDEDSEGIYL